MRDLPSRYVEIGIENTTQQDTCHFICQIVVAEVSTVRTRPDV